MNIFPQTVYCWGSILERKELATLTGRAPELCAWAPWLGSVAGPCPPLGHAPELCQLCGWALWLGLVLLLAAPLDSVNSVAGLCGWALSSSCPPRGRAPELCQLCGWALWLGLVPLLSPSIQQLCGWALWPGSVSGSCPPLVLVLAAPLNSVAGLCGPALRPHLSKKDKQTTRVTQKVLCFQFSELSLLYLHPPPIYIYINNEQLSAILILA